MVFLFGITNVAFWLQLMESCFTTKCWLPHYCCYQKVIKHVYSILPTPSGCIQKDAHCWKALKTSLSIYFYFLKKCSITNVSKSQYSSGTSFNIYSLLLSQSNTLRSVLGWWSCYWTLSVFPSAGLSDKRDSGVKCCVFLSFFELCLTCCDSEVDLLVAHFPLSGNTFSSLVAAQCGDISIMFSLSMCHIGF